MTGRTPVYGIPYPDGTTKVNKLGDELALMGKGVEAALLAAGIPDVTNPDRAVAASDTARNAHFGVPPTEADRLALQRRGAECVRTDKGWTERYFATYNASTNPQGATPAGWYPIAGARPMGLLGGGVDQAVPNAVSAMTPTGPLLPVQSLSNMTGAAGSLTAPIAGLYRATTNILWLNNATGARLIYLRDQLGAVRYTYSAGGFATAQGSTGAAWALKLAAGDSLAPVIYQNSGGSLNALASGSQFLLEYIGVPK